MALQSDHSPSKESWLTRLRATLLGLQFRVTVLVMALVVSVTTILCGQAVDMAWRSAALRDRSDVMLAGELLAASLSNTVTSEDTSEIREMLEHADATHAFAFAQFSTLTGTVVAHVGSVAQEDVANQLTLRMSPVGTPVEWYVRAADSRIMSVKMPVADTSVSPQSDSNVLGYVTIGIDRSRTIQAFDADADVLVGSAIAIILLIVPLGFLIVRRVVQPLHTIAAAADQFSGGDLSARADINRRDEIGHLADQFNHMAEEVQRKQEEITTLNEHLEHRVRERTNQLRDLAARDPLTGLYNRRHFNEELTRRLAEADRFGKDVALILIDVDDFKTVNDTMGHQDGDRVLSALATSIQSSLRATDIAARFGGDEFVVLMPGANCGDARVLAARIMEKLDLDLNEHFGESLVTLSVGVSCLSQTESHSSNALVHAADEAMYRAKDCGKNQIISDESIPQ